MIGNFYISVSNGLIEGEHRKRIGAALWEFLWCLDKITKIDEHGVGYVLGGKPINLDDIASQMNVDKETISRNLIRLEEQQYIKKLRTPYGIVIKVLKAKKRFNKNVESIGNHKDVESRHENVESNKIVSIDINSIDNMQPPLAIAPSEHYKFIKYWSELVQITRNIKPIVTAKDAKNLQRILKQEVITSPQLEKLAMYFLGHHSFTKFSPSISTFLSSGILMGLINRMRNGPEFWKELDTIARRHKREAPAQEASLLKAVEALRQKMTWTKN